MKTVLTCAAIRGAISGGWDGATGAFVSVASSSFISGYLKISTLDGCAWHSGPAKHPRTLTPRDCL